MNAVTQILTEEDARKMYKVDERKKVSVSRAVNRWSKKQRLRLIKLLGSYCCCVEDKCWHKQKPCGLTDTRCLQIDHIHGGGSREVRHRSKTSLYSEALKNPQLAHEKYQILCANCNWIKRFRRGEHRQKHRMPRQPD